MGFNDRSHRIKASKAWSNYGLGAATSFGLIVSYVILTLGQGLNK